MAEGRRSQHPMINLNVNVVQQGDSVEVKGDNVRSKTNVSAERIRNVSLSAPLDDAGFADIPEMEGLHLGQQRDSGANFRPRERRVEGADLYGRETAPDAMRIYRLGERSNDLMGESKQLQALQQLQLLNSVQPNQLKTMLMIAECNIMLDRQKEALKVIFEIEKLMAASGVRDIFDESDICVKGVLYLRAMIFLFCAAKSSAKKMPQSEALLSVGKSIDKLDACSDFVMNNVKSLHPAISTLMIPFMENVLVDLDEIVDCDADSKARVVVRCMANIADSHLMLKNSREAIKMYNKCLNMMQRQYGLHASKFRYYAEFLGNIAWCHMDLAEYEEAKVFFTRSIPARVAAEDFKDEKRRERLIGVAKKQLRRLEGRTSDR